MLIKKKKTRSHTEDRCLALVLATAAGILNAMALGAFGFFPSHMTGNASQISTEISSADINTLIFLSVMLMAFIIGSTTARFVVIAGLKKRIRTVFCLLLLAEGVTLFFTSLFETHFYSSANNREVLVILCFLMGIHNSTSTQLSDGRVRATHVTGTLTDVGIVLGSYICSFFHNYDAGTRQASRKQLYTHLTTIFSFLSGCIAGLLLYKAFGFKTMTVLGMSLISVAFCGIVMTLMTSRRLQVGARKRNGTAANFSGSRED